MAAWVSRTFQLALVVLIAACAAEAQNTDIGLVGLRVTYAREVLGTKSGSLFVEIPAGLIGDTTTEPSFAVTPGIRFRFASHSRVSFYTALGFGFVSFGSSPVHARTLSGAMDAAGAIDIRVTKLVSIRGETREYLTAPQPAGSPLPGRNHVVIGIGVGLHF